MEILLSGLIVLAVLAGGFLVLRQKARTVRDTADFAKDIAQQMLSRGTRMSALIAPADDPVNSVIDARLACVAVTGLVLCRDSALDRSGWRALHRRVQQHYRTGKAQADDLVMLTQWLVGALKDAEDLDRMTTRAAELSRPDQVAQEVQALLSLIADDVQRPVERGLMRVLAVLERG